MSKKKAASGNRVSVLAAIFAVVLIGLASLVYTYYTPLINSKDAEIAAQSNQIASLNATISNLNSMVAALQNQISDLQEKYTANLVTALGANEISSSNSSVLCHLYISGTVTDTGVTTAYNAGLHINGYASDDTVLINITVPIGYGVYQDGFNANGTALSTIYPTQSQAAEISIFHNGNLANWTITPVWTNSP
jgi:uncharacterized coiled-coil protein SlyX